MVEHAVYQKSVHVLQDGLVQVVCRVRDFGIVCINISSITIKTSMSVMLIMAVITTVTTLMDLMCVHALMATNYTPMANHA